MKQTKQFLRPLLMAIVMLVGMLMPQGAWAEDLEVWEEENISISSDASYDMIYVYPGGMLIINEGVTLTVTDGLNIIGDDNFNLYGTVINYGTIKGEGSIHMYGGVLANHGHIDLGGADGYGTFYNTGTPGDDYFNLTTTTCDHDDSENLGTVDATCTHGAGTQVKCYTCFYIGIKETGKPLPHDNYNHNGLMVCSNCGHTTFDATPVGEGTAESPYQIANAGHLFWFADKVNNDFENFKEANAVLTADIVVNDGTFADDGTFTATGASEPSTPIEWLIIGRFDMWPYGYGGTFDGQGHTISGLYANYRYSGFVGMSSGECKIKNVGVINSYFDGDKVGGICGNAGNYTEISNCYSSNVICKGSCVGGILGLATNNGVSIVNCYSTASLIGVEDWAEVGGIAGESGSTTNCYTTYGNATGWSKSEINCEANVSLERFASGEIAYKLNGSIDGEGNWTAGATDGTQKWYQKLGENGDSYPVLAAAEGNTVYEQKTIDCGGTVVACNYYNTEEEDVTQPHDYHVQLDENSNPVFVWSEDCTTATLQLVCSHNAEHTAGVDADMVSWVSNPATCTTTGVHAYSATVEYDGQTYADYKNVEIDIDHNAHDIGVGIELVAVYYDDIIKYINRQELMPETDVSMRCKECGRELFLDDTESISGYSITYEITMDPNCWRNGFYNFNLEINIPSGDIDSFSKNSNIYALGHSFTNHTLTAEPDEHGLYAYVCDREECGEHGDYNVVKAGEGESATTIELTADGEGNFSAASVGVADGKTFSTPVEFTVPSDQVTVERTFTAEKPASVMLPFSIDASLISDATFYEFGGVSYDTSKQQWVATMKTVDNVVAYKPYLVIPTGTSITFGTSSESVTFLATSEASNNMTQTDDDTGWTFKAVNTPKTWTAGDSELGKAYGFAGEDRTENGVHIAKGQFVKLAAGATAAPGRSYLTKENADWSQQNARRRGVAAEELPSSIVVRFINGEATGIATLNTETGEFILEGWYDLNGRKINAPAKGGIYVKDGKKVLVK